MEISAATCRLVSNLLTDYWLICSLCAQCIHVKCSMRCCVCPFFFKIVYNKTIIRFGLSNIRNNQYPSKCFQQSRMPRLITVTCRSTLIIPDVIKTSSYNCLKVNPVCQFRVEIVKHRTVPCEYNNRSNNGILLNISTCKSLTTLGDRSFYMAAPKLWNELPLF